MWIQKSITVRVASAGLLRGRGQEVDRKDRNILFSNMIPQGQAGKRFVSLFTKVRMYSFSSRLNVRQFKVVSLEGFEKNYSRTSFNK